MALAGSSALGCLQGKSEEGDETGLGGGLGFRVWGLGFSGLEFRF